MSTKNKKIAVVLLNLGGPDCKNAIKPFLMNFFMDKNILSVPIPFRCILAARIAGKRSKREAGEAYGELGDKSPLLENSKLQAEALDAVLAAKKDGHEYKSFICMRYWHPMSPQVVRDVRDWGADKVILLPLYPQFSTTTTWSSLEAWQKALSQSDVEIETSMVCCYPDNTGFVNASADHIKTKYDDAIKDGHKHEDIRFLFSAHGLPEKIIKGGDPYQHQCESTMNTMAARLKDMIGKEFDYQACYQSRVGPMKWIGPSLDQALEKAAEDKKTVIIFPHAFTQEHVETLVELDVEYKEMADHLGIKGYYRAHTVGTHPEFINGLSQLVEDHIEKTEIAAEGGKCICPDNFDRCCMRQGSL